MKNQQKTTAQSIQSSQVETTLDDVYEVIDKVASDAKHSDSAREIIDSAAHEWEKSHSYAV